EIIQTGIKPGTRVRVYYANMGDLRMVDHVVVVGRIYTAREITIKLHGPVRDRAVFFVETSRLSCQPIMRRLLNLLLLEGRCEFEEALSNLCLGPGRKTKEKRRF